MARRPVLNRFSVRQLVKSICILVASMLVLQAFAEMPAAPPAAQSNAQSKPTANQPTSSEKSSLDVAPFVAEYHVKTDALPLSGKGIRSLKHLGDGRYRMEQIAKSFLLTRREISEFSFEKCKITPKSYRNEQSGIGRDRRELLDFHLDKNSVTFEESKKKQNIQLPEHTPIYDRLSETLALQCQLIQQASSGAGIENAEPILLKVVDKGRIREHEFKITRLETIRIAKTDMPTLRVERVNDSDERETVLWFAPGHHYALVKMQHLSKGKTIIFTLESIKQVF